MSMICKNCERHLCICVLPEAASTPQPSSSPLFDPGKFTEIAQTIFKNTSHARLAMWVRIFANICKAYQIEGWEALSERNIRLLEYVALFHDSARKNEDEAHIWETTSAALCRAFLVKNGISREEAARFSCLIIKTEAGSLLGKILQSADCLERMPCEKVFQVEKIPLYSDLAQKEDAVENCLLPLVKEAGKLIQAQSDMREDVWVTLQGEKAVAFKKSRDAENPELKAEYALAENGYSRVTADLAQFPWLGRLYQDSIIPPLEEQEEEKEEEENNFFGQPEILSYGLVLKEALPADRELARREIYLQKTARGFAYAFLTSDGELAKGNIPRKAIPGYADLSPENIVDALKKTILRWLFKKETAVLYQKALRVDEYIYVEDRFIPGIGQYIYDGQGEEKQAEDVEENKLLNKITLRKARAAKKGIYIVKRGEIYVSDLDEAGNLVFFGTDENGKSNGIPLAPLYTPEQKEGSSKPQSVSLISDKIPTQSVFGFGREGETPPVVALFSQRATLSHAYFSRYDAGTVGRPGDFASYAEAEAYRDRKYRGEDPPIRTAQAPFLQDLAAGKNIGNYTEPMMRLKWVDYTLSFGQEEKTPQKGKIHFWREGNTLAYTLRLPSKEIVVAHFEESHLEQMGIKLDDTFSEEKLRAAEDKLLYALRSREHIIKPCCLGLPENHTLSSRILTQNIAQRMHAKFGKKPRVVYMAAFPQEVVYTEDLQRQDREAAESIAADPKALSEALDKKDFYFLLGLAPEKLKAILDTSPQVKLIHLYTTGYVDFAKQLAQRAKINLKEIVRDFDWAGVGELHPVAIEDLALHHPAQYKTLQPGVVNAKDAKNYTMLDNALYFGRLKCVLALLKHSSISRGDNQEIGGRFLVDAIVKGYKNIAQKLFAGGFGYAAFALAAQNGYKNIEQKLLESGFEFYQAAFAWAVQKGEAHVVKAWLAHPAKIDPNMRDGYELEAALIRATQKGHAAVVEVLLAHPKTDPNVRDAQGGTALTRAVRNGHIDIVKALLAHPKMDFNIGDRDGIERALTQAVQNGHAAVLEVLLAHPKMDFNMGNGIEIALMQAVQNGHAAVLEVLLAHPKMDFNRGDWIETALTRAVQKDHAAVVEVLLAHPKANPNVQDMQGETLFMWAIRNSHAAVVKVLLAHPKMDFNMRNGIETALTRAVQNGHMDTVKVLLAHPRTNPTIPDAQGNTALTCAARNGHIEIVQVLLAHPHPKIDPNVQDVQRGDTALICATRNGRVDIVKALLAHPDIKPNIRNGGLYACEVALTQAVQKGNAALVEVLLAHSETDPNVNNGSGETALTLAVQKGYMDIVKILLVTRREGPNTNPNARCRQEGKTALIRAVEKGDIAMVEVLLAHPDLDPNLEEDRPQDREAAKTPLKWAVEGNHVAIVQALLAHPKTNPNHKKEHDDKTVLMRAARDGKTTMVKTLLTDPILHEEDEWVVVKLRINPNLQDKEGCTALMFAVQHGEIEVVKALLAHPDMDTRIRNERGKTALDLAKEANYPEMVALFRPPSMAAALGKSFQRMWRSPHPLPPADAAARQSGVIL